jgi:GNAT superfamily N-acetyltransferase
VWIATGTDGQIAGVVALAPGDAPGTLDLNKLFIEPRHICCGLGRAVLAHAVAEARRRGAERLNDPRRPERGGLLRAQRRGADRRGAVSPERCRRHTGRFAPDSPLEGGVMSEPVSAQIPW